MFGLRALKEPCGYGKVIREFRLASLMSQSQFGRLVGTEQRTVSTWESRGTMRQHFRSRCEKVMSQFDVYGPGSYSWYVTEQLVVGKLSMKSALDNAPSQFYDRAKLKKYIKEAIPSVRAQIASGELEII